jgi:cytochrome c-type biogenesis protein
MQNIAATSLLLGFLTTASPCILPLYPGFLAYLSSQNNEDGRKYFLGVFVLAVPIGRVLLYMIPLADLLLLLLGILLLLNYSPFKTLPQLQLPGLDHPYAKAYTYGLLYGPIAFPCSGPLVVAIFALSFTAAEAFSQLWSFLWFGLGLGIPLLILSFLSAALQRQLTSFFARHSRIVNMIGGLLLIGVAIHDLGRNWVSLQLFWKTT